MALVLITPPATEPVTLEEAKLHCRVDHAEEDALIEGFVTAAREYAEAFTHRAFVPQTWERVLGVFPAVIRLPKPPLLGVESITYLDPDGVVQTLDPAVYQVVGEAEPAAVLPAHGPCWPAVQPRPGAVRIRFRAGYPKDATGVLLIPRGITTAIRLLVGHWYANRETVVVGASVSDVPHTMEMLLWPFRVLEFA